MSLDLAEYSGGAIEMIVYIATVFSMNELLHRSNRKGSMAGTGRLLRVVQLRNLCTGSGSFRILGYIFWKREFIYRDRKPIFLVNSRPQKA